MSTAPIRQLPREPTSWPSPKTVQNRRGAVNERTDAKQLCLVVRSEGIELTNFIPWFTIASIRYSVPVKLADVHSSKEFERSRGTGAEVKGYKGAQYLQPDVRSLDVIAVPANFDADAEIGGLRVWIAPLSKTGAFVPTHGTVTVRFEAEIEPIRLHGSELFVDSWTKTVDSNQFGPDGLVLDLPFHLPSVPKLGFGRIHVRLGVPGTGTFEAVRELGM